MEITNGANGNILQAATGKAGQKPAGREAAAAKKVAQDFESLFVGMMIKSMRETVGKDKLTNGGHGEEVYRSLLDQEYARALTEHGGVGMATMLERQISKPATEGGLNQGIKSYDTTNQSTKTEVTYENR